MAREINLSIFERIAYSGEEDNIRAQRFLVKHGFEKARDQNDLAAKLAEVVEEEGEEVIPEILQLHPDAEHFKEALAIPDKKPENVRDIEPVTIEMIRPARQAVSEKLYKDCGCSYRADSGVPNNWGNDDAGNQKAIPPMPEDKPAIPAPAAEKKGGFYENYSKHLPGITAAVIVFSIGFGALIAHMSNKSK